jgi:hypothetical protein
MQVNFFTIFLYYRMLLAMIYKPICPLRVKQVVQQWSIISENKTFLFLTVIQFTAALSLQIALKVQHSKHFFINLIKCENIFTATEARLLPNVPTQNRPPDSRLQTHTHTHTPRIYWVERKVFAFSRRWRKHKIYCHLFKPFWRLSCHYINYASNGNHIID